MPLLYQCHFCRFQYYIYPLYVRKLTCVKFLQFEVKFHWNCPLKILVTPIRVAFLCKLLLLNFFCKLLLLLPCNFTMYSNKIINISLYQLYFLHLHCYCDVSRPCEDLPDPLTSSSRMVHRPAVQVNRFSWFNNANTDKHLDEKRREFRYSKKYPNSSSLFPHNRHLSSLRSVCKRWCRRWPEVTGLKVRGNKYLELKSNRLTNIKSWRH